MNVFLPRLFDFDQLYQILDRFLKKKTTPIRNIIFRIGYFTLYLREAGQSTLPENAENR